ncbi:prephenate dehydratase [Planctomycetota bacterium]|nr:prephenate dehydratase [Planctomycetota bacterium]
MPADHPPDHAASAESILAAARTEIDAIDRQLVALLSDRAAAVKRIGAAKLAKGEAIFVPHREAAVFQRICSFNHGPLRDSDLRAIWREIMSAAIALEQPQTICHFGQPGAFTHAAARLKFGAAATYIHADAIAAVFAEVERGRADYGVVPIENSTDGTITDTIDAFLATPLRIVSELHLRIRHHLLARCPRSDIRRIYSRHTVFGQCRQWLAANLPGVELIEVVSTTKGAERAAGDAEPGSAAIASEDAGRAYDLPVVAGDIQDNAGNLTRFVVVADPAKAAQPTGDDKTSLMFSVQDRPSALHDCLLPFHRGAINLSRIESRPSRRRHWEYLFFIDISGHQQDPAVAEAIAGLRQQSSSCEILGSYPRADRPLNE